MRRLHEDALRVVEEVLLMSTLFGKLCSKALNHGVFWLRPGRALFTQLLDLEWVITVHDTVVGVCAFLGLGCLIELFHTGVWLVVYNQVKFGKVGKRGRVLEEQILLRCDGASQHAFPFGLGYKYKLFP